MSPISKMNKESTTILVLDPSAAHLAYCIAELDSNKKEIYIEHVGMLWASVGWPKGKRFSYIKTCLTELVRMQPKLDAIYTEGFFVNPKQMFGAAVIPTINGIVEMIAYEQRVDHYEEIPPPSWRALLKIKPTKDENGKRDYKTPTKLAVEAKMGPLPEQVTNNLNSAKQRKTPTDIADCLAITLAIADLNQLTSVKLSNVPFYNFTFLNKVQEINKEYK